MVGFDRNIQNKIFELIVDLSSKMSTLGAVPLSEVYKAIDHDPDFPVHAHFSIKRHLKAMVDRGDIVINKEFGVTVFKEGSE